jgi:hypothetical protein
MAATRYGIMMLRFAEQIYKDKPKRRRGPVGMPRPEHQWMWLLG